MNELGAILKDFGPAGVLAAVLWLVSMRLDKTIAQLISVVSDALRRNNELLARVDAHLVDRQKGAHER